MTLLLCMIVVVGIGLVAIGVARRRTPALDAAEYLRALDDDDRKGHVDQFEDALTESFLPRVLKPMSDAVMALIARATPVGQRDALRGKIAQAGLSATLRAEDFLAIQFVGILAGCGFGVAYLLLGTASPTERFLAAGILAAVGVLGPRAWLSRKVAARKLAIFLDLPDVLDLLAISVEAGVGFEGALAVVCQKFASPLSAELSRTLKEMELGLPRRDALQNLKRRTEVPELSNFVLALIQADALGMPIGRVLHTQATEMRNKRRQWAREKAAKLPVKILFPLVLFIFPAILIVLIGPAASSIGHAFRH